MNCLLIHPVGGVCFVLHPCCSWKDIVNKVNARMDEQQAHGYPKSLDFDPKPGQEVQQGSPRPPGQQGGEEHQTAEQEGKKERADDEELAMGMVSLILCCTVRIYCESRWGVRKASGKTLNP